MLRAASFSHIVLPAHLAVQCAFTRPGTQVLLNSAVCSLQHARALWVSATHTETAGWGGPRAVRPPHIDAVDTNADSSVPSVASALHPAARPTTSPSRLYCRLSTGALRLPAVPAYSWSLAHSRCISQTSAQSTSVIAFPLAQTGEGISECELIQWFVKEGDAVKEFDKLCEVQSDKASVEISSRFDGVVRRLLHNQGDVVKVGATLVELEVPAGTIIPPDLASHVMGMSVEEATSSLQPPAAAAQTTQPHTPSAPAAGSAAAGGATGTGGTPTAVADRAETADAAAAIAELSSQAALHHAWPGLGAGAPGAAVSGRAAEPAPGRAAEAGEGARRPLLASPAVRRLARDMGLPLHVVPGSGPEGRITKEDVLRYAERTADSAASAAHHPPATKPATGTPHVGGGGHIPRPPPLGTSVLPLKGYRRAMAKSMAAVAQVPHFYLHDEAQVDVLTAVRKALAADPALHGAKLTLLPFIIKAISLMLAEHPLLNASLSPDQASITLHGSHNIGVAMATAHGLVVPNIKQVESLSVVQVAREIARLQAAAAVNKLSTEDVTGGTITVSNIGSIGGMLANPLVNPPEVAILAVGRIRPVAAAGHHRHSGLAAHNSAASHHQGGPAAHAAAGAAAAAAVQHVVGLSWGADHRVVDGAAMAAASNVVKAYLEAPERMLIRLS